MDVVCGLLKLYFRELPEPLVPAGVFHSLAKMLGKTTDLHPPPTPTRETGCFPLRKYNLPTRRNFSIRLLLLFMDGR